MSISRNFVRVLGVLLIFVLLVVPAWGFSRQQRLRIPLLAQQDDKKQIDSIAQGISGVYTAQWIPRRNCLFVVYDRTRTNQKIIIATLRQRFQNKKLNFAIEQGYDAKKVKR